MRVPKILFLLGLAFIFASSSLIYAAVPQMINYQGKITAPAGALVDTTVQMTFTIYDDSTTGNVLWADTLGSVEVEKGIFSVLLGSNNSIPDSVFDGNIRYLGTKVGSDPEMTPRKAMVSVAYAYRAGTADWGNGGGGGWVDDGSVVRLETSTDKVGIGTTRITLTDDGRLDLNEDGGSTALSIATNSYVGMGTTSPDKRLTLKGDSDTTDACIHLDAFWNPEIFFDAGTSQADGKIHFQTSGTEKWTFYHDGSENSIKFNKNGTGTVLYLASSGRVGIGTTSPSYKLDVNGDINVAGSYNVKKGGTNYTHPDYVFETNYELMPLEELEKYVSENKCLPNVISAEEVNSNNGFKMDELLIQMLEKIEEQTLYILQLEKRISELEKSK